MGSVVQSDAEHGVRARDRSADAPGRPYRQRGKFPAFVCERGFCQSSRLQEPSVDVIGDPSQVEASSPLELHRDLFTDGAKTRKPHVLPFGPFHGGCRCVRDEPALREVDPEFGGHISAPPLHELRHLSRVSRADHDGSDGLRG